MPQRPNQRVTLGEQLVRVFGEVALNSGTYTLLSVAVRDGKPINIAARFSFAYRNQNGRWVIIDHHSSVVPTPPR